MGSSLLMSGKERDRLVELARVKRGEQSLAEAGRRLSMSYRQVKRLWMRYRKRGAKGLVHRGRGQPSNARKDESIRARCLELYRGRLEGFGPTLAAEKLSEWVEPVSHDTVRRWLIAEGLWQARARRYRHRRWRARKAQFGEMVQLDGSHHDWFGRGERCCLLSMIDDATATRLSRMSEQETTADALELLRHWILRYGIPGSLYVDRKSVYLTDRVPTLEEQLADEAPLTTFGKACKRLGIRVIPAASPQAKGRIERSHAVYQDRLVKEIRLQQWSSMAQVNADLEGFDDGLNRRFSVPAVNPADAHRPLREDLSTILVWEEERAVRNDWTLSFKNQWLQLIGPKRWLPPPRQRVTLQRQLDGTLHAYYRGHELHFETLPHKPLPVPKPSPPAQTPKAAWIPPKQHPWRTRIDQEIAATRLRNTRRGKAYGR
jgi:hypothetical protein